MSAPLPRGLQQHVDLAGRVLDPDGARVGILRLRQLMRDRAFERAGGGYADRAGHRVRGVQRVRREIARRDRAAVARRRRAGRPWGSPCRSTSPKPMRLAGLAADRLDPGEQLLVGIDLRPALVPVSPKSFARIMIIGIATSMQVTSMPSITSRTLPVGSILPEIEPTTSMKFRMIGAAVPGTPSMRASPAYCTDAAGRLHHRLDARLGVDVVDHHARLAVLRRDHPGLDREGRDARQHVAAGRDWCRRSACRYRPARTGNRHRRRAASTSTRSRPCWSACRRRRARRSGAGRASPWRRAARGRAPPCPAGRSLGLEIGPARGAAAHEDDRNSDEIAHADILRAAMPGDNRVRHGALPSQDSWPDRTARAACRQAAQRSPLCSRRAHRTTSRSAPAPSRHAS